MAKLTLNNIESGYLTHTAYNANNALIEAALENTLSRDGTTPNQMGANLDMNSNRILNLSQPLNSSEAARLADVQAAISGLPTANLIPFTPYANIASNTVQGAIQEEVDDLGASSGSSLIGFIRGETGATSKTTQTKLREFATTADFGGSLELAITGIGATQTNLLVNSAVALSAATVVPANISIQVVKGGTITQGANALTINGPFYSPRFGVFSGAGVVSFGQGSIDEVFPEWWQSNTTPGTTDMASAIQLALNTGKVTSLDKGIYRANTTIILNTGNKLVGKGLALSFIHSYAEASPCVATTLAALCDASELFGFQVIAKASATAVFDLSTARNGRFINLANTMNERTGGGACIGFRFGKTVPAAANYGNVLRDAYSFDLGATAASSVSLVLGKAGDGANANTFENLILDGSNRGVSLTDTVGCRFRSIRVMNAVTEAVLLSASSNNSFELYIENVPANGTVDATSINNIFEIFPDAGLGTPLNIANSLCQVSSIIQKSTPTSVSHSTIHDVVVKDWTGVASKNYGRLTFKGVEGAALVRIVSGGVTVAAGGGASTAEFLVTFINSALPVVTAIAAAATNVGTAGAITATPSLSGGNGVVTFAVVGNAVLQNSFLVATEVLHTTHSGDAGTVYGSTLWEQL